MTPGEELTKQFLAILDKQGFNIRYIKPFLKVIIYDEYGNEVDRITPTEEDSILFKVEYPEFLTPICQYCQWVAGQLETRDEWFLSIGAYDRVFRMNKRESIGSFYDAFSHASTTVMLKRLDIPTWTPPWCNRGRGGLSR